MATTSEQVNATYTWNYDDAGLKKAAADAAAFEAKLRDLVKTAGSDMPAATDKATDALKQQAGASDQLAGKSAGLTTSFGQQGIAVNGLEVGYKKLAVTGGIMTGVFGGTMMVAMQRASEFNKAMAEVSTLAPVIAEDLGKFKQSVLDVSTAMGFDAVEGAKAMYQAVSAGVKPEAVEGFLKISSQMAIGGVTDITTAVDGLTTATNAWSNMNLSAERASDVLFAGMKAGKTTIGELSSNMFTVAPIASAMGVSIEEVAAANATLTKSGTPTSVAMNQIKASLVVLEKGAAPIQPLLDDLAKRFPEMGEASGRAALGTLGYQKTMQELVVSAQNLGISLPAAFGRVEGAMAATTLSTNMKVANQDLNDMMNSAGATAMAYEIMAETGAQKSAVFKATLDELKIGFGDTFAPIKGMAVPALTALVDLMIGMGPTTKIAVAAFVVLGAAAGVALTAIGLLGAMAAPISAGFATMGMTASGAGMAIATALGPITVVAVGLLALHKAATTWKNDLRDQIADMKDGENGLSAYGAAAKKAADEAGFFGQVGNAMQGFLGSQNRDVILGTDSWLKYTVGVDNAVMSNNKFKLEAQELKNDLGSGAIPTVAEYEAAMIKLADSYSVAEGKGRVLTEADKKVKDAFIESTKALTEKDRFMTQVLAGDAAYASMTDVLADKILAGTVSQEQATKAISSYVDMRRAQLTGDAEASEAAVGGIQMYSDALAGLAGTGAADMAVGFTPVDLMSEEQLEAWNTQQAEFTKAHVGAFQSYLDAEEQYKADLAQAEADDIVGRQKHNDALAKAGEKRAENEGKLTEKLAGLWDKRFYAEDQGKDTSKIDEQIAKTQTKMGELTTVEVGGYESKAAAVQKAWEAEELAQREHLAQMALDQLNAALMGGTVAEEQAQLIYGSIASAFPGSELFSPAAAAAFQFSTDFGAAMGGNREAVLALGTDILDVPRSLDEAAEKTEGYKERATAAFLELAETEGRVIDEHGRLLTEKEARLLASGEVVQTSADLTISANQSILLSDEELSEAQDTTAERQQTRLTDVADTVTTTADTWAGEEDRKRLELLNTLGVHGQVSEELIGTQDLMGVSALELGEDYSMGFGAMRTSFTGISGDIANEAKLVSQAWGVAGDEVAGAWTNGTVSMETWMRSQAAVPEVAAQRGTEAKKATDKEKGAYDDATRAAQDHGGAVRSEMEDTGNSVDDAREKVEELAAALDDLPRMVRTEIMIKNYEDTKLKLAELALILSSLRAGAQIPIQGTYAGTGPAEGGQSIRLQHDIEDAQAQAALGVHIPGEYHPLDKAMEPKNSLALESWIGDAQMQADLGVMLEGYYVGSGLMAADEMAGIGILSMMQSVSGTHWWVEVTGRLGDDTDEMLQLGQSGSKLKWLELLEEIDQFRLEMDADDAILDFFDEFFGSLEKFEGWTKAQKKAADDYEGSLAEMYDEIARFMSKDYEAAPGQEHVQWPAPPIDEVRRYVDMIRNEDDPEKRARDIAKLQKVWKDYYDELKDAEDRYHKQRMGNLNNRKKEMEDEGFTKEQIDGMQIVIDGEKDRHDDFMRDLDMRSDAIEGFYDDYSDQERDLADLQRTAEKARKDWMKEIKDMQDSMEDDEDVAHDHVLARLDEEMRKIEAAWKVQEAAFKKREAWAKQQHEGNMNALEAEKLQWDLHMKARQKAHEDELKDVDERIAAKKKEIAAWKEQFQKFEESWQDVVPEWKAPATAGGRRKKIVTGPPKIKIDDPAMIAAVQQAIDAGTITDMKMLNDALRVVQGEGVRQDRLRALFEFVSKNIEDNNPLETELATLEAEKVAVKARWEIERAGIQAQLDDIDTLMERERTRHKNEMSRIAAAQQAAKDKYELEKDGIAEAKRLEEERHKRRMEQIAEEMAFMLMLAEGLTPEEARERVEEAQKHAKEIADEAGRMYDELWGMGKDEAERKANQFKKDVEDVFEWLKATIGPELSILPGDLGGGGNLGTGSGGAPGGSVPGLVIVPGAGTGQQGAGSGLIRPGGALAPPGLDDLMLPPGFFDPVPVVPGDLVRPPGSSMVGISHLVDQLSSSMAGAIAQYMPSGVGGATAAGDVNLTNYGTINYAAPMLDPLREKLVVITP